MKKVLVVDDDESIVDAISLVLEEEGYTVASTLKGEETYTKIISFKPDVVILDVLMSGCDGREICKQLKSDKKTAKIPIIMISAHPTAKDSVFENGADDFIAKPFDTNELIEKVEKYVEKIKN